MSDKGSLYKLSDVHKVRRSSPQLPRDHKPVEFSPTDLNDKRTVQSLMEKRASEEQERLIILGAAGRDFHDFNVYWKLRHDVKVIAFTATQIPNIAGRRYPPELAGEHYPDGIPIYPESELENLIKEHNVKYCQLAYSDLKYHAVMELCSRVTAAGAIFLIQSPKYTMLKSIKPVISVCATRTGCGKSQTSRYVAEILKSFGKRIAVVRHPMPYGNLVEQRCQRYNSMTDIRKYECTIEEIEEYEQHIEAGNLLFAGVDYEMILKEAEKEADVIIWDGGNNDTPFFKPDLAIVVTDPLRRGEQSIAYPGETNLRLADIIILNKCNSATGTEISRVKKELKRIAPKMPIIECDSVLSADIDGETGKSADEKAKRMLQHKNVLVIDDGPTLTHGDMAYGAAYKFAHDMGAEIIDPRAYLKGTLKETFRKFPKLEDDLPAMGYGKQQVADLQATVLAACRDVDAVVVGTPIHLNAIIDIPKPCVRVRYTLAPKQPDLLRQGVQSLLEKHAEIEAKKPEKSQVQRGPEPVELPKAKDEGTASQEYSEERADAERSAEVERESP